MRYFKTSLKSRKIFNRWFLATFLLLILLPAVLLGVKNNKTNENVQEYFSEAEKPSRELLERFEKIRTNLPYSDISTTLAQSLPRSESDRPDDFNGSQVHVMYVIPSDAVDENLDTNGAIVTSVNAFQKWFANKTGGKTIKMDTYQSTLDVSFYRLPMTNAQVKEAAVSFSGIAFVQEIIKQEVGKVGFNNQNKIYAVYYDGGSDYACGGASWPPSVPGNLAAMYLEGKDIRNNVECPGSNSLTTSEDTMLYWEYAMLHDIVHTLGIVPRCATHHAFEGHVGDDPRDLMYTGSEPWNPMFVDIDNDDYFRHSNSCLDLEDSTFLTTSTLPSPTNTPTVTGTPIPTVTTAPGNFALAVSLPGIGANTSLGENPQPVNTLKAGEVSISGTITPANFIFQPQNFTFSTEAERSSNSIIIKVRTDNSLWRLMPGGQTNTTLVTGDMNLDNELSILDYNMLLGCYGTKQCAKKTQADLNLDGKVDEKDLNIFYSGLAKRQGD